MVPVTVFQAIKPPTTDSRMTLFCTSAPKKLPSTPQNGEDTTPPKKFATPGMTVVDRKPQMSMTLSLTDRIKSMRPESSSTPKKLPSKLPLTARSKKDCTPGTSVPVTQLYRSRPVSLIVVSAVMTPESDARPNRFPS